MERVPPTLSPAQHKLWASEPDVPRRAVDAVVAELGALAPDEGMLAVASRGAIEAAVTFDGERGATYADWAFSFAVFRVWEWLRRAHGRDKQLLARIRTAMFRFLAHERLFVDPWDTRARSKQKLHGFSDGLLMGGHMVLHGEPIAARGEDDLAAAEDSLHVGNAVRKLIAELTPERRLLLTRCAAYGEPVKEAAKEAGKGYRAVLRDYHDLLALMGARLAGMEIKEMPQWHPEISGEVFEDPPEPANDGGRG